MTIPLENTEPFGTFYLRGNCYTTVAPTFFSDEQSLPLRDLVGCRAEYLLLPMTALLSQLSAGQQHAAHSLYNYCLLTPGVEPSFTMTTE